MMAAERNPHVLPFWVRHPLRAAVYRFFVQAGKRAAQRIEDTGFTPFHTADGMGTYSPYGMATFVLEAAFPRMAKR